MFKFKCKLQFSDYHIKQNTIFYDKYGQSSGSFLHLDC